MEKDFFGSKLNTFLLFILIVIVAFTLWYMMKNPLNGKTTDTQTEEVEEANLIGIEGDKEDLVFFSIAPYSKVSGIRSFRGSVRNAYFFEANILINILDKNKKSIMQSNAMATTDWMTTGPVEFEGNIDFTNLPKGNAYIEILEDDPSGGESGAPSRILIPIVIE